MTRKGADLLSSKQGATEVEINLDADVQKLTVQMYARRTPKFYFEGMWSGKDISTVIRTIQRAYLMYNRELRREGKAINQEPVAERLEVTSDAR